MPLIAAVNVAAMPVSKCLIWGLVDGQLCRGRLLDSDTAATVQGWNPPLTQRQSLSRQLQQHLGSATCTGTDIRQLEVGWQHTLLLLADGRAYACDTSQWRRNCTPPCNGTDASPWRLLELPAQLQLQQQHSPPTNPAPRSVLQQQQFVQQVAAGDGHCLLLCQTGSVWALGSNRYGQVGCMDAPVAQQQQQQRRQGAGSGGAQAGAEAAVCDQVPQPVLVLGPGAEWSSCQEAVAKVAAGACHSAAVTAGSGRLFCWGWNAHGQCCTGSTVNVPQPQLCESLDGVPLAAVAAGMAHTVCVSRDGAVYACGWNSNGQLGTAQSAPAAAATAAGSGGAVSRAAVAGAAGKGETDLARGSSAAHAAFRGPGGSWSAGGMGQQGDQQEQQEEEHLEQQQVEQQQELVCVSSLRPQLVEAPGLDDEHAVQVACGSRHTLVLTASGSVFAWGWNKYAQCCTAVDEAAPTDVLWPARVQVEGARGQAVAVHAGRMHSVVEF